MRMIKVSYHYIVQVLAGFVTVNPLELARFFVKNAQMAYPSPEPARNNGTALRKAVTIQVREAA